MSQRPTSDVINHSSLRRPLSSQLDPNTQRKSEQVFSDTFSRPVSANIDYKTPEAVVIDKWFEDLSYYERTLDQMSKAKLDDSFKEELKAMEQWFQVLTDVERTTVLYSLLKSTNQVQIRFFITVLQQKLQPDTAVPSRSRKGSVTMPTVIGEVEEDMLGMNAQLNLRLYDRQESLSRTHRGAGDIGPSDAYRRSAEIRKKHQSEDEFQTTLLNPRGASLRPTTPIDDSLSAPWSRRSPNPTPLPISRPISPNPQIKSPRFQANNWHGSPARTPSEFSDEHEEERKHKEKGKIPDSIDLELIKG